jgi:hypothetical protein
MTTNELSYSVRIEKHSIKGFVQVKGTILCKALDSYKQLGYNVKTIKKLKGATA